MPIATGSISYIGAARFQGFWNARTNEGKSSPAGTAYTLLLDATGSVEGGYHAESGLSAPTPGHYWQVTGSGDLNVNDQTDWDLNDWVVFSGSAGSGTGTWFKLAYEDTVASVILGDLSAPNVFHLTGSADKHVLFITGSTNATVVMSGSDNFVFDHANDRVGIGTTSPAKHLHVNGASGEVELRMQSSDKYASIIQKDNSEFIIQNASGGDIIFYDDSAETMRIADGGNVGIGVTDPDSLLEIFGTSTQLKLSYDATNYSTFAVGAAGGLTVTTVDPDGADADLTFTLDGAFDVNANQEVAIDSTAASITVGAALADGQTLKLGKNGAVETIIAPHGTAGSELYSVINTAGTTDGTDAAGAILLSSVAGGIGLAWADDKDLWAEGGQAVITANHNASEAIKLHADAGANQTIQIINDEGTTDGTEGAGAIDIEATVGGISIHAADDKDIWVEGGQIIVTANHNAADAIKLHADAGANQTIQIVNDAGTTDGSDDAGAIELSATAGGIGLAWADDKDLWAEGGKFVVEANEDASNAIKLTAASGSSQTVLIQNVGGTGTDSIALASAAGGITLTSASGVLVSGTTPKLTIGDGGAEDTMLVFDGNAIDYRIGIDDAGTVNDVLEIGVGTTHATTPAIVINTDAQVQVVDAFAANTAGTFGTFSSSDTTPSVATGNLWKTHASSQTLTMFDDGIAGQTITVISTAAVVFDVTSTNLKGGSTNITTASGDVTVWTFDGTNWYLQQFMDVSADMSSASGGSGTITALNNQSESRLVTIGSTTTELDGEANMTFDGSTLTVTGHILPGADATKDLGSASYRWRNIYTGDLHLKNERGDWTIVEEEDYLTIVNNKKNKKYKFVLEEIE